RTNNLSWHGRFMPFCFSSAPKSCHGKSRGSNTIWMQETACHKSPQRIQLPLSTEFLLLLLQLLDLFVVAAEVAAVAGQSAIDLTAAGPQENCRLQQKFKTPT